MILKPIAFYAKFWSSRMKSLYGRSSLGWTKSYPNTWTAVTWTGKTTNIMRVPIIMKPWPPKRMVTHICSWGFVESENCPEVCKKWSNRKMFTEIASLNPSTESKIGLCAQGRRGGILALSQSWASVSASIQKGADSAFLWACYTLASRAEVWKDEMRWLHMPWWKHVIALSSLISRCQVTRENLLTCGNWTCPN